MTVTQDDLKAVHARVGRLEDTVSNHQTKMTAVAEDVSWIKGYLEKRPVLSNGRAFQRDVGMVAGGGGIVGTVLFLLERLFGG